MFNTLILISIITAHTMILIIYITVIFHSENKSIKEKLDKIEAKISSTRIKIRKL